MLLNFFLKTLKQNTRETYIFRHLLKGHPSHAEVGIAKECFFVAKTMI